MIAPMMKVMMNPTRPAKREAMSPATIPAISPATIAVARGYVLFSGVDAVKCLLNLFFLWLLFRKDQAYA